MKCNVSVIIVNWNAEKYIERCIHALHQQTIPPYEIIVIDNTSSDGSVEILQRIDGIKLIIMEANTGFAGGNNYGVAISSQESEWIALLNPDAFPAKDWLEKNMKAIKENPGYGSFGSVLIDANNPNYYDGIGDIYHISGRVKRRGYRGLKSKYLPVDQEIFSPCAAAAMYRRDIFLASGGFDEDYFCYVEDVDLGFRLQLLGYKSRLVADAQVDHIGSGTTGGQKSDFAVYHGNRNVIWTYIKNMPGLLFWSFLPLHILFNVLNVFIYTLSGQGSVVLKSKYDAMKLLPKMWRKRKNIQSLARKSTLDILQLLDKSLRPGEK